MLAGTAPTVVDIAQPMSKLGKLRRARSAPPCDALMRPLFRCMFARRGPFGTGNQCGELFGDE